MNRLHERIGSGTISGEWFGHLAPCISDPVKIDKLMSNTNRIFDHIIEE